jgi:tetratricopeptide (TPR) repeat protein
MIPCLLNLVRALLLAPFFILLSCNILAQELKGSASGPDLPIPAGFAQKLDSLRRADNLEEWLYQWMDYVKEAPPKRLSLLSAAESSAWRKVRNDRERLAWFYLLANQGYYQLYAGNIIFSIDAYERAYRFYFEKPLAQADVIEYVLKPLGNNYTRLGDYDRAFFIQEKSLALALSARDPAQLAAIYNNLAISSRWNGKLQEAAGYCKKGLLQVEKNTPLNGLLLSTLADILLQSKQNGEAQIRAEQAIKILRRSWKKQTSNNYYWLMSAYEVQGNLGKEKGDWLEAFAAYKKALYIADNYFKGERKREKAKLKLLIGDVLLLMQQPAKALQAFDDALTILLPSFHPNSSAFLPKARDLYGENTLLDALEGKAKSLLLSGNKEAALECFLLSFEVDRKQQGSTPAG